MSISPLYHAPAGPSPASATRLVSALSHGVSGNFVLLKPLSWDTCGSDPRHRGSLAAAGVLAGSPGDPADRLHRHGGVRRLVVRPGTTADFLRRGLVLSPVESTFIERQIGIDLFVLAATWEVPLFLGQSWASARERGFRSVRLAEARWTRLGPDGVAGAGLQAVAAGVMVTLILLFRSRVSPDFIDFQF